MKFWGNVGDPSCFPTPLSDCLRQVSFSRYSPLNLEVVEKQNKCKSFSAPIFSGGRAQLFYGRLLAPLTIHSLAKFGWVGSAGVRLRSLAMKWNVGWVKMAVQFEAVCRPKFMAFWHDVGDPAYLSTHLPDYVYHVSFLRYRSLKLPSSCQVLKKRCFGFLICRGKGYPRFSKCVFKLHLLPTMWPIFVEICLASSEIRWRKNKEERIRGKT